MSTIAKQSAGPKRSLLFGNARGFSEAAGRVVVHVGVARDRNHEAGHWLRPIPMVKLADSSAHSPLAPGARLLLETASGPIAIFEVDGTVHAIEDGCLRCGSSLTTGALAGTVVTCSVCGWKYDIASGCLIGLPALRVPTCRVRASRQD